MTDQLCIAHGCASPRPEHQWLCSDCVRVLRQDLRDVPGLVDELQVTAIRWDVFSADDNRRAAETPLPFKPQAGEALYVLASTMTAWVRALLHDNNGNVHLIPADPTRCAHLLLQHVQSLAMLPAAGEAVDEIRAAVKLAYRTVDRPPELLLAGVCEQCETEQGGHVALYARPQDAETACRGCGATHDVDERYEAMLDAAAMHLVTANVALGWVRFLMGRGIPRPTFDSWVARGRVLPHTVSPSGHPLYQFDEVRQLAATWEPRRTTVAAA
jgi:hypothetical protein